MQKFTTMSAAVGLALAVTFGLAGCTLASQIALPKAGTTARPSKAPSVNIAKLAIGDAVDKSTAWAINGKGGNLHAYELPNGTFVVIKVDSPLPPIVQADVDNVANAGANDTSVNGNRNAGNYAHAVQGTIEYTTGKNVAVIQYGNVAPWDGDTQFTGYLGIASFYNASNPAPVSTSEATVAADVQAEINAQPDAASWIIVVNN